LNKAEKKEKMGGMRQNRERKQGEKAEYGE